MCLYFQCRYPRARENQGEEHFDQLLISSFFWPGRTWLRPWLRSSPTLCKFPIAGTPSPPSFVFSLSLLTHCIILLLIREDLVEALTEVLSNFMSIANLDIPSPPSFVFPLSLLTPSIILLLRLTPELRFFFQCRYSRKPRGRALWPRRAWMKAWLSLINLMGISKDV